MLTQRPSGTHRFEALGVLSASANLICRRHPSEGLGRKERGGGALRRRWDRWGRAAQGGREGAWPSLGASPAPQPGIPGVFLESEERGRRLERTDCSVSRPFPRKGVTWDQFVQETLAPGSAPKVLSCGRPRAAGTPREEDRGGCRDRSCPPRLPSKTIRPPTPSSSGKSWGGG